MNGLYAVILCGGRGERFWPRSRSDRPKQFIRLFGSQSLTKQTSERIARLCPKGRQLLVAPKRFARQLSRMGFHGRNVVFEPVGRNTAPAIGLAAALLVERDPDAVMVVLPADHLVEDGRGFLAAVRLAAVLARKGFLVTFGIPPTRPDTGYGYVQVGEKVVQRGRLAGHRVLGFREKPNPTTARRYVASGDYLWNSGMFVWRAADILEAFCRFLPDFHADLMRFSKSIGTSGQRAALNRLYRRAPSISIDYAVMEKAANVAAVRGRFDWDDVGSWLALDRHLVRDRRGNIVGTGCAVLGSERCLVQSDQGIVAVLACSDLVVVRSGDAVLVAHKDGLGEMKNLLADIRQMPGGMKYL